MEIGLIGLGNQGKIIAQELINEGYNVTGFDIVNPKIDKLKFHTLNVLHSEDIHYEIFMSNGLIDTWVCALPSEISWNVQKTLAVTGNKVIDISFNDLDYEYMDALCRENKTTYITDCGLAPGLPNFIIGDQLRARRKPKSATIYVGGIAIDPLAPYGYCVTWDPKGLEKEYVQPATIIKRGVLHTKMPLKSVEPYRDVYESFLSDGLRTLVKLKDRIPNMSERTIRHHGHCKKIAGLIRKGEDVAATLQKECPTGPDKVLFEVDTDRCTVRMNCHAKGDLSAMAQTTAYTAVSSIITLLRHGSSRTGFISPEEWAENDGVWPKIQEFMMKKGIWFNIYY